MLYLRLDGLHAVSSRRDTGLQTASGDGDQNRMLTPYAVLLVKPTDDDRTIRAAYHEIAKESHPDRVVEARAVWELATQAYTAVKTQAAREAWAKTQALLSGACNACEGSGVTGTRLFKGKVRLCEVCRGEGRV